MPGERVPVHAVLHSWPDHRAETGRAEMSIAIKARLTEAGALSE
jgi:hypothetical protein